MLVGDLHVAERLVGVISVNGLKCALHLRPFAAEQQIYQTDPLTIQ